MPLLKKHPVNLQEIKMEGQVQCLSGIPSD